MEKSDAAVCEEVESKITFITKKGTLFKGAVQDEAKAAKFETLKRLACELKAGGGFIKNVSAEKNDGSAPHIHAFVDFPSTVLFREERKGAVPALMNLADSWTLTVRDEGGIRLTLTVLDLWKE
jgi:hypothetical protein